MISVSCTEFFPSAHGNRLGFLIFALCTGGHLYLAGLWVCLLGSLAVKRIAHHPGKPSRLLDRGWEMYRVALIAIEVFLAQVSSAGITVYVHVMRLA